MDNKVLQSGYGLGESLFAVTDADNETEDVGEVMRITLDIPVRDAEFLRRLASYRNAMAAQEKRRLPRLWSAKSLAESFIKSACKTNRQALKEVLDALGDLPMEKDREAMAKYVEKAARLEKKPAK